MLDSPASDLYTESAIVLEFLFHILLIYWESGHLYGIFTSKSYAGVSLL